MKLFIFTASLLLLSISFCSAQSVLSADKIGKRNDISRKTDSTGLTDKEFSRMVDRLYTIRIDKSIPGDSVFAGEVKKKLTDSLRNVEQKELQRSVDKLNESSMVKVLASGGISNMEDFKKAYGNLGVGLQFRLSKFKVGKKDWIDPHYLYLMFNAKTASSRDSSSIQKTFLFPELNKRDFVIGYFSEKIKNGWHKGMTFEFSLNRFEDTVNKKDFVSQSFMLGYRINKSFPLEALKTQAFLQLHAYYNLINVDSKFVDAYKDMTKEPNIHPTFHSIGVQSLIQVENLILFCNMKYILNKQKQIASPDLIRFVYTIGTMVSL